jgi:hypothetical protein
MGKLGSGSIVLVLVLGAAACGGDDDQTATTTEAAPTTVTTAAPATTAPAAPTEGTLPSGATVSYPSSWTSYGAGFTGSLELGIPGVANVSVRDAAASEYLYGPQLPDSTLEEAFGMMEFAMGSAAVGEAEAVTAGGAEMLTATVDNAGKDGVMAVAASGNSFASVYAESVGPPMTDETVEAVLLVLASLMP